MRRRLVWIQGAAQEAIFYFLYQAPDGYYVVDAAGSATFAAPLSNTENPDGILPEGFTVTGPNDWRVCAEGRNGSGRNVLFYGPSGLLYSLPAPSDDLVGTFTGSGLITNSFTFTADTSQSHWYTHLGTTGNSVNTFPADPPDFVLPNVTVPAGDIIFYRINEDMSWATDGIELVKADGTKIPIISGGPSSWPTRIRHSFVGLTLYRHVHPDVNITSVTTTPYTYDPDTGTATEGAAFSTPITPPNPTWTHLYTRYWPT